ncbi:hypothetical protein Taro_034189 [Colocasia esculenta]|uniref:Uncharacterized protein n=1 Tax=Colocasia esculenta TaxID=4460 RepID=A0A843W031_COLES|nr:hypothetical protein [Colocasia esculenta]
MAIGSCVQLGARTPPQIFVRAAIGTTRESPIWNQHFDTVGTRFLVRRPNSSPGVWSRAADAITYGHPFAQTGITFCSVIGIAYKAPIRNRHSEMLVAPLSPLSIRCHFGVEKPSFRTPKLQFRPTISTFPRFSCNNVSLDHVNPGRGNHTESACHGDRKLCSTRCGNSSPDICSRGDRNVPQVPNPESALRPGRHKVGFGDFQSGAQIPLREGGRGRVDEKPSFRTLKVRFRPTISSFSRFSRSNVSLDHVNPGRGNHTESACHGDWKLCSTRCENSSPGRSYGCTNIADIVTPFGLFSPLP